MSDFRIEKIKTAFEWLKKNATEDCSSFFKSAKALVEHSSNENVSSVFDKLVSLNETFKNENSTGFLNENDDPAQSVAGVLVALMW